MRSLVLALTLLLAAASPAAAQVYGAGVTVQYGNALVPPTSSPVLTTAITYRELGGFFGNLLVLIGEVPVGLAGHTDVSYETDSQGNVYEVRTTYPPTAEETAAGNAWMASTGRQILNGEMGQDLQLDIALRQLGGDATGFMFKMWRPIGGPQISLAQFYFGYMTFHDVTSRIVSATNGTLMSAERTGDQSFAMVGTALRLTQSITDNVSAHLQIDLNAFTFIEDDPSPLHLGVELAGPHTLFRVEAMTTGFRPEGLSLNAEVVVAL